MTFAPELIAKSNVGGIVPKDATVFDLPDGILGILDGDDSLITAGTLEDC